MATFEGALLDEPSPRGTRLVALALLDDLVRERDRLQKTPGDLDDREALHDFRVALRRLRSWLRAVRPMTSDSQPRRALRRLRRIAKESNAGRDADVFLEWLRVAEPRLSARSRGAARWLIRLFEAQRREADVSLQLILARDFGPATERARERLQLYHLAAHVFHGLQEPVLAATLAGLVREHAARLRRRLEDVRTADDERAVHRARIAGKRLRYLLEPIAPHVEGGSTLIDWLKQLQDALGDLHDAHIWLLVLREVVADLAMEEGRRRARQLTRGVVEQRMSPPGPELPAPSGFVLLARMAQERAGEAFSRFRDEWAARGMKRFFRDVEALCTALEARSRGGIEIERKYLLKGLPQDMPEASVARMIQGYLPGSRLVERLRAVRQEGEQAAGTAVGTKRKRLYYRTVKFGRGLVRTEIEEATSREVFDAMWPLTRGRRLSKRRYRVPDGALAWEIDEFTDRNLVLAEVELPSPDTPISFPDWLAPWVEREVTGEPAFQNANLAR